MKQFCALIALVVVWEASWIASRRWEHELVSRRADLISTPPPFFHNGFIHAASPILCLHIFPLLISIGSSNVLSVPLSCPIHLIRFLLDASEYGIAKILQEEVPFSWVVGVNCGFFSSDVPLLLSLAGTTTPETRAQTAAWVWAATVCLALQMTSWTAWMRWTQVRPAGFDTNRWNHEVFFSNQFFPSVDFSSAR